MILWKTILPILRHERWADALESPSLHLKQPKHSSLRQQANARKGIFVKRLKPSRNTEEISKYFFPSFPLNGFYGQKKNHKLFYFLFKYYIFLIITQKMYYLQLFLDGQKMVCVQASKTVSVAMKKIFDYVPSRSKIMKNLRFN